MSKTSIRQAAETWINGFDQVPASIFQKLAQTDEAMTYYDSDSLRLVASPYIECNCCYTTYEGELSLGELQQKGLEGSGVSCLHCPDNAGEDWILGRPVHAFPCAWGTLFAPRDLSDSEWTLEHADEIASLGFFVFESDDWGCLLGIDGAGFDFYEKLWIPLYRLRGLTWHVA